MSLAWRKHAACANHAEPDLWFPGAGSEFYAGIAKQVCRTCPVRTDCLEHALSEGERFGIWGGLSARERDSIRRRRAAFAQKETA